MLLRYTAYDLNNALIVAAKIYNYTSGSPVFVETKAMAAVGINGSYVLDYLPPPGLLYFANMMVYTDDTFVTPDLNYTPGDAQLDGVPAPPPWLIPIVGFVNDPSALVGLVNAPQNVVGFVNCECD